MSYGTPYPLTFSSREEVRRQVSEDAELWHSDHTTVNDELIEENIQRATGTVKGRLNKLFDDVHLSQSPWVRHRCTVIACYYLSKKRGNAPIYESDYFHILEEFAELIAGEIYLEELPRQVGASVVMQNVRSDNRTPFNSIRVDPLTSTETVPGQINVDKWVPYSWF